MILNITNGKISKFDNLEKLIEAYCQLPLKDKVVSFVLGVDKEALDYPGMMEFMLDYSEGYNQMVEFILSMDQEDTCDK